MLQLFDRKNDQTGGINHNHYWLQNDQNIYQGSARTKSIAFQSTMASEDDKFSAVRCHTTK